MRIEYNEKLKKGPLSGYFVLVKESKKTRRKECVASYKLDGLKNISSQMHEDYKKRLQELDHQNYELISLFIDDKKDLEADDIDISNVTF